MIQVIYKENTRLRLVNFFNNFTYWQYNGESSIYETGESLASRDYDLLLIEFLTEFGAKRHWEFKTVVS